MLFYADQPVSYCVRPLFAAEQLMYESAGLSSADGWE